MWDDDVEISPKKWASIKEVPKPKENVQIARLIFDEERLQKITIEDTTIDIPQKWPWYYWLAIAFGILFIASGPGTIIAKPWKFLTCPKWPDLIINFNAKDNKATISKPKSGKPDPGQMSDQDDATADDILKKQDNTCKQHSYNPNNHL